MFNFVRHCPAVFQSGYIISDPFFKLIIITYPLIFPASDKTLLQVFLRKTRIEFYAHS